MRRHHRQHEIEEACSAGRRVLEFRSDGEQHDRIGIQAQPRLGFRARLRPARHGQRNRQRGQTLRIDMTSARAQRNAAPAELHDQIAHLHPEPERVIGMVDQGHRRQPVVVREREQRDDIVGIYVKSDEVRALCQRTKAPRPHDRIARIVVQPVNLSAGGGGAVEKRLRHGRPELTRNGDRMRTRAVGAHPSARESRVSPHRSRLRQHVQDVARRA